MAAADAAAAAFPVHAQAAAAAIAVKGDGKCCGSGAAVAHEDAFSWGQSDDD